MKQLVILSGKGGTGKTSVAAALAHLASTEYQPDGAMALALWNAWARIRTHLDV